MNKKETALPKYITKAVMKAQLKFGLAMVGPAATAITLAYLHGYLSAYMTGALTCAAVIVFSMLLSRVKDFIIISAFAIEEVQHIKRLCALDEGFEEFWNKYNNGFSEEDMKKIKRNMNHGARTEANAS